MTFETTLSESSEKKWPYMFNKYPLVHHRAFEAIALLHTEAYKNTKNIKISSFGERSGEIKVITTASNEGKFDDAPPLVHPNHVPPVQYGSPSSPSVQQVRQT